MGAKEVIPEERKLKLNFRAVKEAELEFFVDNKQEKVKSNYNPQKKIYTVEIDYDPQKKYELYLKNQKGLLQKKDLRLEKLKKWLKYFKLETVVKTDVAQSIEKALAENNGAEFLERFKSVLSQSQLETIIEVLYYCGSARIKNSNIDQLLVFKGDLKEMNYNFSKAILTGGHHSASVENEKFKVKDYKLIDLQAVKADKWSLNLNYSDFIKKEYSK